jgi:hypothetical protein
MLLKLTAILLGLYALYLFFNKIAEGFQSAGTILQLETSHVPGEPMVPLKPLLG